LLAQVLLASVGPYLCGAGVKRDLIHISPAMVPHQLVEISILFPMTLWAELVLFLPGLVYG
jgi:hypothetical protein